MIDNGGFGHRRAMPQPRMAAGALALLASAVSAWPVAAQNAIWLDPATVPGLSFGTFEYNAGANWSTGAVPVDTAIFGATTTPLVSIGGFTAVGGWTFTAAAPAYTFMNNVHLTFTGAGIAINGGSASIASNSFLEFLNASTAGGASITNNSYLDFFHSSTAGSAAILNTGNGTLTFNDSSSASGASISNFGTTTFKNTSTAGSAVIVNASALTFNDSSSAGSASINNGLITTFKNASTAGSAHINNIGFLLFTNASSADHASITNIAGDILFFNTSSASAASITIEAGNIFFNDTSRAGSAEIVVKNDWVQFHGSSTADAARITNINGTVAFLGSSSAGSASIVNNARTPAALVFDESSRAGSASITNNGDTYFQGASTADNALFTNSSTGEVGFYNAATGGNARFANDGKIFFFDLTTGGSAQFVNNAGGLLDFSGSTGPNNDHRLSAGSVAGAGSVYLGANELTIGGNNLSTTVSGVISDCGASGIECAQASLPGPSHTGGGLVKTGTGQLTLSGLNTYTGATTVNDGTLSVDGSIASSALTVNAGGTLGGNGIVGNTTINGGSLAPGHSIGLLTVQGNLVMTAAASYMVEVSGSNADRVNVTGAATLGGATVKASFAPGGYLSKRYTIVSATGGINGSFGALASTNLPATVTSQLSYDATHAYLDLQFSFAALTGLTINQRNVANAVTGFFNSGGALPLSFAALTPAGLTQASGEHATGSQQATFNAMTQFMGLLTDPFAGRGYGAGSAPLTQSFAEDQVSAYAARPRNAFGMVTKAAPPAPALASRWNVWAAGFGGEQTTDGEGAVLGSHSTTSRIYGTAVGADYLVSPDTLAGFALAGGATQFSVAGLGSGRSDLFQAGAYLRHQAGASYLAAALAYGWQDVTTDRTVTIAGIDQLQARFNANAWSGRLEGGRRFVAPWGGIGITPYAAAQFTTFDLPGYAEHVAGGAGTFALSYAAKTVTDPRTELGIRTDKSLAWNDAVLTLRGRAAWVHDYNPDRSIAATFQSLPGASFVVNGALPARDAALTSAAAEWSWRNGLSVMASFDGEFSGVTRSYAGKGVVRYSW